MEISDEVVRSEKLNEQISKNAVDRGSEHELWRRAAREGVVLRNKQLVLDLWKQEKCLKKKLGIV